MIGEKFVKSGRVNYRSEEQSYMLNVSQRPTGFITLRITFRDFLCDESESRDW